MVQPAANPEQCEVPVADVEGDAGPVRCSLPDAGIDGFMDRVEWHQGHRLDSQSANAQIPAHRKFTVTHGAESAGAAARVAVARTGKYTGNAGSGFSGGAEDIKGRGTRG